MKKVVLSVFVGSLILFACTQKSNAPKEVQDAFSKKFAQVKSPKWEQEDNEWEAEFKVNDIEMSASFDKAGAWLETETEISKSALPAAVLDSVNQKYDGWKMKEVEQIEQSAFSGYEIELELEQGETVAEIQVTIAGEITVKKMGKDEDDEDAATIGTVVTTAKK